MGNVVKSFNDTTGDVLDHVKHSPGTEWISPDTWRLVEERINLKPKRRDTFLAK